MEPFFSGVALGLLILIPLVLLVFAIRLLMLAGAFVYGFAGAAHASWAQAHAPAVEAERGAHATQLTGADAQAWKTWLEEARQRRRARNERELAWMDRHWLTAWYARLYRRVFRYPSPEIAQ